MNKASLCLFGGAFLGAGLSNPVADFTGEGDLNFLDVSAFLAASGAGCP